MAEQDRRSRAQRPRSLRRFQLAQPNEHRTMTTQQNPDQTRLSSNYRPRQGTSEHPGLPMRQGPQRRAQAQPRAREHYHHRHTREDEIAYECPPASRRRVQLPKAVTVRHLPVAQGSSDPDDKCAKQNQCPERTPASRRRNDQRTSDRELGQRQQRPDDPCKRRRHPKASHCLPRPSDIHELRRARQREYDSQPEARKQHDRAQAALSRGVPNRHVKTIARFPIQARTPTNAFTCWFPSS